MFKKTIVLFSKFYLFWLLFYCFNRFLFLGIYHSQWEDYSVSEVAKSLWAGFRLDLSTISYFAILFILLYLLQRLVAVILRKKLSARKMLLWFTNVLLLIASFVNAGEAGLYGEWGAKLNATALSHLLDPREVIGTASTHHIFLFLIISILQISIFHWLIKQYFFRRQLFETPIHRLQTVFIAIMLLPVFYLLRGGLQPIPINISDANYSNKVFLNDVAINPTWNLINSIRENKSNLTENPYAFMPIGEAQQIIKKLLPPTAGNTPQFLTSNQPNIVMLIMESWSADIIEELDGLEGLTPFFGSLCEEGYLFDNFYANGWTSDQGIGAILSAHPVFPHSSVINQSDKSRKVSSLSKILMKEGYHTSFHFGGQLSYGNIKAYLLNQQFELLKEQSDLTDIPSGRLGIHDEYMYDVFAEDLNTMQTPFLSAMFTVSTHSPYDIPREMSIPYQGEHLDYLKSAKYADECMQVFFDKVRNEPWYDNTLFVIIADHSHKSPIKHRDRNIADNNKIPFLLYGSVLKDDYRGARNSTLGSQIDILGTLLPSLGLDAAPFGWSKNLMQKDLESFVPYVFHYGIGIHTPQGGYSYIQDRKVDRYSWGVSPQDAEEVRAKCQAYFQVANEEFMEL